ncbi:hypothetical protein, conserved [Eimeria tenella]|uniref:START domain-containing protein n=1 Tax=Eimeria tenella TaxID=5802 RepID=U6L9Z5_EIMTE|nr:hypothetical protein, conserved [Eimeria tenella]CDJ45389.1 hypothetical protein, conserved [Eimeria tenella]|eukprot:XP_013236135.1 hypothetical protein, conserved [Eimeria tenella]
MGLLSAAAAVLCRSKRAMLLLLVLLLLQVQVGNVNEVSAAAAAAAEAAAAAPTAAAASAAAAEGPDSRLCTVKSTEGSPCSSDPREHQQQEQQQQQQQQQQPEAPIISDELLLDLLRRAEEIRKGPPEGPPAGWEVLSKNVNCIVYRRKRRGQSDYEYAVWGRFADISAAAYLSTLNSLPLRSSWDSTVKDIQLLQLKQTPAAAAPPSSSSSSSGGEGEEVNQGAPTGEGGPQRGPQVYPVGGPEYEELIYWRVGLPWPAKDRDFVFARRLRGYRIASSSSSSSSSSSRVHALVCGQLQAESDAAPPVSDAVRVTTFEAAIVAFPDNEEAPEGAPEGAPQGGPEGPLGAPGALDAASPAEGRGGSPQGAPRGAPGGDPEKKGVTYVALHYDRSR